MRKLLLAAAATAPLAFAVTPAAAQTTTISSSTSTPVATATAASGAPSNVDVSSSGVISTGTTTPGVTLNSSNSVTIEGQVSSDNVSGATGVLVQGGATGSLSSTGTISITEDFTATDTLNSDGIPEAPVSSGSNRYGVLLTGASPFTGSITLSGTQSVKGNTSYVVDLEAPLTGALTLGGTTALTGDNGAAVRETAGVGQGVNFGTATTVQGQNSSALVVLGDVGGAVRITSATSNTGYSADVREADTVQAKVQATPTDVEQAGPAFIIGANVAGGVYLSAPPTGTVSGSTADLDGDGVADGVETAASITQYGTAPALVIGAANKAITVGAFGTGDAAYGLYVRGTITSNALIDGQTATAVQIGAGAGSSATVTNGARIVGTISATSYEANATALHVLAGGGVPNVVVNGALTSVISDSTLITTPTVATSTALLADAGATLGSLTNTGTISASATGNAMNAGGVVDRSGTLTSVLNEGVISAGTAASAAGLLTGSHVALDLSQNTSGVTLTQQTNPNPNTVYGSTSGTADTATTTVTAVTPTIAGDVLLGSGPNTVNILAGTLSGALSLGSGEGSSLTIDGGATVAGAVTYTGGSLALNIANGTLDDSSASTLKLSSLNIGATGKVVVAIDGLKGVGTSFVSSAPATIAAGATFGVNLLSLPAAGTTTYTIVSAPTVSYGGAATQAAATTSYLYDASFNFASGVAATTTSAGTPGTVTLDLTRRSQAETGLTNSEYNSLDGVLAGTAANPNLLRAALQPTDKDTFVKVYDQLLPDHAGGVFLAAQQAAQSIGHAAIDARAMDFAPGAWTQEFAIGVEENRGEAVGAHAGGFGVSAGAETGAGAVGQFGVSAAFVNAQVTNPEVTNDSEASFSELEAGLYWRAAFGGLQLGARASGGYLFGYDRRYISLGATDVTTAVATADKGTWNGYTLDGRVSAGYQVDLGKRWFVRPQLVGEYFRLNQDAYTEHGGGNGVDLAVDSRTGDSATGTASVVFGAKFGRTLIWRPSLELGAQDVFSGNAGDTTASFVNGNGSSYTLVPNSITGVGGLVRAGLTVGGSSYEVYIDAQGQEFSKYREGDVRGGVRVLF